MYSALIFGWPWNHDMVKSPSIRPFERMLAAPEGTVPVEGGALTVTRIETTEIKANPLPVTAESVARGHQLFQFYCAACHGQQADGRGPVAAKLIVRPSDLGSAPVQAWSDGYLFGTIRYGGVVMPSFSASMSPAESWEIVGYLRTLKRR